MNFSKILTIASVLILVVLLIPFDSFAQKHGFGMKGKRGPGMMGEHAKNLDNLRMLKLLEVLDMDDDQSDAFILKFSKFRNKSRELNQQIGEAVDRLAGLLNAETPDEMAITKSIEEIDKLREQRIMMMKELHDETAKILTPIQIGKMVVFEERFEKRLLEKVRGFRRDGMPPDEENIDSNNIMKGDTP